MLRRIFIQFPLQGSAVNAEPLGRFGNITVAVGVQQKEQGVAALFINISFNIDSEQQNRITRDII